MFACRADNEVECVINKIVCEKHWQNDYDETSLSVCLQIFKMNASAAKNQRYCSSIKRESKQRVIIDIKLPQYREYRWDLVKHACLSVSERFI